MITQPHCSRIDFIFQYPQSTGQPPWYQILCPLEWNKFGATFYYFEDLLWTAVNLLLRSNGDFHSDNLDNFKIESIRRKNVLTALLRPEISLSFVLSRNLEHLWVIVELNKMWLRGGGRVHWLLGWPHLTELKNRGALNAVAETEKGFKWSENVKLSHWHQALRDKLHIPFLLMRDKSRRHQKIQQRSQ